MAVVLVLALAGLAPRLLAGPDRGVVRPPRPVPAAPVLVARLNAYGPLSRALAFSSDGKTLAVAGTHRITLWNLDRHDHTEFASPETSNGGEAIAFAPDGRTLAAVAGPGVVLWALASRTRRMTLPPLGGLAGTLGPLAFSPDGRALAAASDGGILVVWDVARRTELAIVRTGIRSINDLAFRANGRVVVAAGSASSGGSYGRGDPVPVDAVTVDLAGRFVRESVRMQAGLEAGAAVAFRRGGPALAVVGDPQQRVAVWNVTRRAHQVTMAGRSPVNGVVLSRDAGLLAMASPAGEVTLWDFGRRVLLGPLPGFHPRRGEFSLSPRTGTFTSDGRLLAISDGTGSVFVWATSP